jgi:hypothetical protein
MPFVNNCDGHEANVTNPDLHQEMTESGGQFAITPAHTTAICAGGAQQCDRGLRDGGAPRATAQGVAAGRSAAHRRRGRAL